MAVQEILIPDKLSNEDKLVHICYDMATMVALCGYKCTEDVTNIVDEADCIVCVALHR